jgi:hypothetical protein
MHTQQWCRAERSSRIETITSLMKCTRKISLCGDSIYFHRLVFKTMMGLRVRFSAPVTGLNSQAVLMLLIVPRRRPSVFLKCMSLCWWRLIVSLVVFSSTVCIFPFTPSFISLILQPPHPFPESPPPVPFNFADLLFNHLFIFFYFLVV